MNFELETQREKNGSLIYTHTNKRHGIINTIDGRFTDYNDDEFSKLYTSYVVSKRKARQFKG